MERVSTRAHRTAWQDLAGRFSDPRECIASFLALEAAEVVAGMKPANLFPVADRTRPCGRNLYRLWKRWSRPVLAEAGLAAAEMIDGNGRLLLLVYRPQLLRRLLSRKGVAALLARAGYEHPHDPQGVLAELRSRFAAGLFPHEIGILLGYPLKDVAGFMGVVKLPVAGQGPWRIYGQAAPSLRLAATFRACRSDMARRLSRCDSALRCLHREDRFFRENQLKMNIGFERCAA